MFPNYVLNKLNSCDVFSKIIAFLIVLAQEGNSALKIKLYKIHINDDIEFPTQNQMHS